MRVNLQCQPAYTIATVTLELEETIYVDQGRLAGLSQGIDIHARTGGGVVKALVRREIAHEPFLMIACTAKLHEAWVMTAPKFPGDIVEINITDQAPMLIEAGAMLAFAEGVDVDARYAGISNIALHEGAAALRVHGNGLLLAGACGGVQAFSLADGQAIILNTGHLLGWSQTCKFRTGPLGGWVRSGLTGEGLVAQITGPGIVYTQSRAPQGIREWILPGFGPDVRNPS